MCLGIRDKALTTEIACSQKRMFNCCIMASRKGKNIARLKYSLSLLAGILLRCVCGAHRHEIERFPMPAISAIVLAFS